MTPAMSGRSSSSFASFSTRLAMVRILSHWSSGTSLARSCLHGLLDHRGEDVGGAHVGVELVRRGEEPALEVPVRHGRQSDRLGVRGGGLDIRDRRPGERGDLVEDEGLPLALGNRDRDLALVARVEQREEGVVRLHLLREDVEPRSNLLRVRGEGVGVEDERLLGRDHAGVVELLGDLRARVAGRDDDLDRALAVAVEIGDRRAVALECLQEVPSDRGPEGQEHERDGRDHEGAPPALAPTLVALGAAQVERRRGGRVSLEQISHDSPCA